MRVRFAVGGKSKTLYLNIVLHPLSGERIRFGEEEAPSLWYSRLD